MYCTVVFGDKRKPSEWSEVIGTEESIIDGLCVELMENWLQNNTLERKYMRVYRSRGKEIDLGEELDDEVEGASEVYGYLRRIK